MPIVGYCHECGEWVWVAADKSCPKGHPASRVNGLYDSATGQPPQAVAAGGTRVGFLTDLMAVFASSPSYSAGWGVDTDMTIASNPLDDGWGVGKKRTEYSAALKVSEQDHCVTFWETLKERSHGTTFGASESENHSALSAQRSGTKTEAVVGPGAASWGWGHGTTRKVVEEIAARHGFTVRVVLTRNSATW